MASAIEFEEFQSREFLNNLRFDLRGNDEGP